MAEESLNLSLDDIIKKNAENSKKRTGGAGQAVRGGRGGRGNRGDRGTSLRPNNLGVQRPTFKVQRGRGQTRGAARPARPSLRDAPRDLDALEGSKPWGHEGYTAAPRRPAQQLAGSLDRCRLEISNLDFNVSDNDIKELFTVAGPLKKYGVSYDISGRSEGNAFVVFERPEDAQNAVEQYNNVALDGKPMHIKISDGRSTLASGIRVGQVNRSTSARLGRSDRLGPLFSRAAGDANIGGAPRVRSTINGTGRMAMDL